MYPLSERCKILRDRAENTGETSRDICFQRDFYFRKGCIKAAGLSNEEIVASGVSTAAREARVVIRSGELLAGYNFADGKYEWWSPKDDEESRITLRLNGISEEDVKRYYTQPMPGLPLQGLYGDRISLRHIDPEPKTERERQLEEEWAARGGCCSDNHSVIGYEMVLKFGFEGLLERVEASAAKNGDSPFYRGLRELCSGASVIGRRYAVEALKLASIVESPEEEADLLRIAEVCKRVPAKPARTFHEALQSLWFAHILNTWEDYINANSLGRLDQILYPYYREDIASGRITREEAFELICCLWIKLYRDYDVQQSCIGGTLPGGADAVNELSYLMLDATEALGFIRCLSVRFSHNTERKFLRRALEVVSRVGKGVPFFFNDDVMIPALAAKGIAYEDACDYTQIGCVETVIPGKANPHAVTGVVNLLKAVEYALADGASMIHPEYEPGIPTGDPLSWAGYKEFHDAVFAQIEHILDTTCSRIVKETIAARTNCPKPVKSLLTSGCVESGRDFNNHGALYDYYQVTIGGIPNLADAMTAVKKLVYGEKRYAMAELINALRKDFPDEAMRLDFVNKAPKYGNDIDEVDGIAAEIMDYACGKLEALSKKYGYSFHAQPFTFFWMVDQGRMTAATPDGRHAGEITAYSVSPMQGRDFCGLTALFNSITKLPSHKAPGTTSAIIEVDPKLFKDIDKLTDILFTAAEKGLCNVQFNTIDAETLRDAQRNPDRHRNLAVRVSGFSQKFHLLNKPLQDHIIARTKHLRV